MDINSLLPLLMQNKSGGEDDKMNMLLKTMTGGLGGGSNNGVNQNGNSNSGTGNNGTGAPDKTKLLTDLLSKDSKNSNIADILALTQTLNQSGAKSPAAGLNAIKSLAPSDILGMLYRFYSGRQ